QHPAGGRCRGRGEAQGRVGGRLVGPRGGAPCPVRGGGGVSALGPERRGSRLSPPERTESPYREELTFASDLALRAGEFARSFFGTDLDVRRKPDGSPVTQADASVESMMREEIVRAFLWTRSSAKRRGD